MEDFDHLLIGPGRGIVFGRRGLAKAVAGIKPLSVGAEESIDLDTTKQTYDYSHLLPEHVKSLESGGKKFQLQVVHTKQPPHPSNSNRGRERLHVQLKYGNYNVGNVRGHIKSGNYGVRELEPHSHLDHSLRGKGLGMAMYEAAYAHAKNVADVHIVHGGSHTSAAHALHMRLAVKHGLDYEAEEEEDPSRADDGYPYGPYSYALKSEVPMTKSETQREVALVLCADGQGRFLFGKRNDDGLWTLPGGHCEPGEDPVVAAARELYEEAGLRPISMTPFKTVEPTAHGRARLHFFSALATGTPHGSHDPDQECDKWEWVDVRNGIPSNIFDHLHGPPGDANLIRQVFDLQKNEDIVWLEAGFGMPLEKMAVLDPAAGYKFEVSHSKLDGTPYTTVKAFPPNPTYAGEHVGSAELWHHPDGEHMTANSVWVHDDHQRQGIASHMYRLAEQQTGKKMVPSDNQTGPGQMLWASEGGRQFGKSEPSEVAALLQHPDPRERALALKLDSATPQDVATGILDPDPWVWRVAFHHPDSHHALTTLASSTRDAAGAPIFDRHHELMMDPRCHPKHLEMMSQAVQHDAHLPIELQSARLGAIHGHPKYPHEQLQKNWAHKELAINTWHKATKPSDSAGDTPMAHLAPLVEAYHSHVLSGQSKPLGPDESEAELHEPGASYKAVYKAPVAGHSEPRRFMVKPYHELHHGGRSGWAEGTSQALYHAGGIGHIHQQSFPCRHGAGQHNIPAIAIHLEDADPINEVPSKKLHPESAEEGKKIALMDFLTNNTDRHVGNLLVRPDGRLLAIDHGHSFNTTFTSGKFSNFADHSSATQMAFHRDDDLSNTFEWWTQAGPQIRHAFNKRLALVHATDPKSAALVHQHFSAKAEWLDKMAKMHATSTHFDNSWMDEPWKTQAVQKALGNGDYLHNPHNPVPENLKTATAALIGKHPPSVQEGVDHFETNINKPDQHHAPVMGQFDGVEPKAVYASGGLHYLLKKSTHFDHHPTGWAEMTSQALFHAAGIGHLHQKVHVTDARAVTDLQDDKGRPMMEADPKPNPAWGKLGLQRPVKGAIDTHGVVIHMEPGALTAHQSREFDHHRLDTAFRDHRQDLRKMALMDIVTSNGDRHESNWCVTPEGKPIAIDHGLAFMTDHEHANFNGDKEDSLQHNADNFTDNAISGLYRKLSGRLDGHAIDPETWAWWDKARPAIIQKYEEHANMFPEPGYAEKLKESFHHRLGMMEKFRNGEEVSSGAYGGMGLSALRHSSPVSNSSDRSPNPESLANISEPRSGSLENLLQNPWSPDKLRST